MLASQNSDARTVVYLVNEAAGGSHLSVVESTYLDQSGNVPVAPGLKGYVNGAQFIPYTPDGLDAALPALRPCVWDHGILYGGRRQRQRTAFQGECGKHLGPTRVAHSAGGHV